MKVAISGIRGNLAANIASIANFEVVGVERDDWGRKHDGCDTFIHCAYDLKNSYLEHPDKVLNSNITAVGQSLKFSLENKISKYIFISSCSVYGDASSFAEDAECHPLTINGMSKLIGEKIVRDFCSHHGIDFLILRPFNSYGGEDHFSVVSKMINAAKNGKEFILMNKGVAKRDFINVKDLARIVILFAEGKSFDFDTYNIGTGRAVSISDILKLVRQKFGAIEIIEKANNGEAKYSMANNARLMGEVDFNFVNIEDWIFNLSDELAL